jgi:hypothetical protein
MITNWEGDKRSPNRKLTLFKVTKQEGDPIQRSLNREVTSFKGHQTVIRRPCSKITKQEGYTNEGHQTGRRHRLRSPNRKLTLIKVMEQEADSDKGHQTERRH